MTGKSLAQVVKERPFPEYAHWWPVGQQFTGFMSAAITSQWLALPNNNGNLDNVQRYVSEYVSIVYDRQASLSLASKFIDKPFLIQSGEFDALSYAFFRSAFEIIQSHVQENPAQIEKARREFTKRVGRNFFHSLSDYLNLRLPGDLHDTQSFKQLQICIQQIGHFLTTEGYLRDHFNFSFAVEGSYAGQKIKQTKNSFLDDLRSNGIAFAIYEMGYPVILPSAVYLYHTRGEAQHHSSRTIEELFSSVGYTARESEDFDPISHPSYMVVEFWEIRKRP